MNISEKHSVLEMKSFKIFNSNTDEKLKLFQADRECLLAAMASDIYEDAIEAGITSSILVMIRKLTCDTQGR